MAEDKKIYLGSKDQITEILDTDAFVIVTSDGIRKMTKSQVMEKLGINELNGKFDKLSEEIANLPTGGSGLNNTAKNLLITILRNGVYSTDQSANITALETALSSGADIPDTPVEPEQPEIGIVQTGSILAITSGVTATQTGSLLAIA